MLRQKQEKAQIRVPGQGCEGAIPPPGVLSLPQKRSPLAGQALVGLLLFRACSLWLVDRAFYIAMSTNRTPQIGREISASQGTTSEATDGNGIRVITTLCGTQFT